jgi:hypothetical protein
LRAALCVCAPVQAEMPAMHAKAKASLTCASFEKPALINASTPSRRGKLRETVEYATTSAEITKIHNQT